MPEHLMIVDHPLIQHKLSYLRDKNTPVKEFRELINEIAVLELFEASKYLELEEIEVETPLQKTKAKRLPKDNLVIVPILRAGLALVESIYKIIPTADIGVLGMQRDETTHKAVTYYEKIPRNINKKNVLILDPMLATGGSACMAIEYLRKKGVKGPLALMVVVAAPEGVEAVLNCDPDTYIVTAALDDGLNENAYILPGLGDAGDRIFGTL